MLFFLEADSSYLDSRVIFIAVGISNINNNFALFSVHNFFIYIDNNFALFQCKMPEVAMSIQIHGYND